MKHRLLAVVLLASACAGPDPDVETEPAELVTAAQLRGDELLDRTLSLTFDDGPGGRTLELADWLAQRGVPATFFVNGKQVPGRQAAIDRIVARGHLLANHTQNHLQLPRLSPDRIAREVDETDRILKEAQPGGPWLLRAPYGDWDARVARSVNATPMKKYIGSVYWEIGEKLTATSAADWDCWGKGLSVERCGDLYLSEIRSKRRGIVLMHDVHDQTVAMTKYILPKLVAEGYSFVALVEVPSIRRALAAAAASN